MIREVFTYILDWLLKNGLFYFKKLFLNWFFFFNLFFVQNWTIAHQGPLSMGFPGQEYWSGLPFPSPWDLLDPGIIPASPALAGGFFTTEPTEKLIVA